jgi:hypothetical protein
MIEVQRTNSKADMLVTLGSMLRDVFQLRHDGGRHDRLARAHGYVDGYMRGLIETGVATKGELLEFVGQQRRNVDGPATRVVSEDEDETAAA